MSVPSPPPIQPVPAAQITLVDVFGKQVEMGAQLLVIHEQLKALPDHEQRIRKLEDSRAKIYGAAAAISVAISAASAWIGHIVTRH